VCEPRKLYGLWICGLAVQDLLMEYSGLQKFEDAQAYGVSGTSRYLGEIQAAIAQAVQHQADGFVADDKQKRLPATAETEPRITRRQQRRRH